METYNEISPVTAQYRHQSPPGAARVEDLAGDHEIGVENRVPASVSQTCLVRFDNNRYSVAASAVGRRVETFPLLRDAGKSSVALALLSSTMARPSAWRLICSQSRARKRGDPAWRYALPHGVVVQPN